MNDGIKLLHLIAAMVWMGGMTFMLVALRPAAMATLEPQPRARLMVAVMQRFFRVVAGAIVVLLATGGHLFAAAFRAAREATGVGSMPLGWSVMLLLGCTMVLIFGHIYFAGYRRFSRAVAAQEWPVAARAAGQIQTLVVANFCLGWLAVVAVRLVH